MKKMNLPFILAGIVIVILIFFSFTLFIVPEGERGISSQPGSPILAPGLHFKWPGKAVDFVAVNNQVSSFVLPLPSGTQSLQLTVLWNVPDVALFQKSGKDADAITKQFQGAVATILTPT